MRVKAFVFAAATMFTLFAVPASATLQVKLNVLVRNDQDKKFEKALREGMEARISSTERYALSANGWPFSLSLSVNCLVLGNAAGYSTGITCDSDVFYYPYVASAIAMPVVGAGGMLAGGLNDTDLIVSNIMNHFINGTTDTVLSELKGNLQFMIRVLCVAEPEECKFPPPKK